MKVYYTVMSVVWFFVKTIGNAIESVGNKLYIFAHKRFDKCRAYRLSVKSKDTYKYLTEDEINAIGKFIWGMQNKNPNKIIRGTCSISGSFRRYDCPK